MSALEPTAAHRAARNQASIDLLDAGPGVARIALYTAPAGTLLAVRHLQKPCGILTGAGRIALAQATDDDLVTTSGAADYAELISADDEVLGSGTVTDGAGGGAFRLAGGTGLLAGGIVRLVEPALLG